jgi:hypothetical protein
VAKGRERNQGSYVSMSGVCGCLLAPYKVSLSSPEPRDQSGHYSAVAVCRLSKLYF